MSDQKTIKKIKALFAKAEHPNTTMEEALVFLEKANELMAKYNLTRDQLSLKEEGFSHTVKQETGRVRDYFSPICVLIAKVTGTRVIMNSHEGLRQTNYAFFGLKADVDYADWIYRIIKTASNNSWSAYLTTPEYETISENTMLSDIHHGFMIGFTAVIVDKLEEMAKGIMSNSKELVICRQELIQSEYGDMGKDTGQTAIALKDGREKSLKAGMDEGDKVILRKQTESVVKGYLK